MSSPNQTDFLIFLRGIGIDPLYLPDSSPSIGYAFSLAMAFVNHKLALVPTMPGYWSIYELAVYNLGTDNLFNFAPDQTDRTYFTDKRKEYDLRALIPGVITSSSDDGTSTGFTNPAFMKNMTIGDLQNLKTPYGRVYMNIAQQYGTIWDIS